MHARTCRAAAGLIRGGDILRAQHIVACGHAMLGITLAPVTGSLIADLVTGASTIDLTAFDPARPW